MAGPSEIGPSRARLGSLEHVTWSDWECVSASYWPHIQWRLHLLVEVMVFRLISRDIHWIYLLDFYTFLSLQKNKESQATHALSKPKRSVSILFGITTKVFKSPMSGGVSNILLDTSHDHSTIQHAFNCINCIDCSFCIRTYFLHIFYSSHFLRGNDSLVDGWDEQLSVLTRHSEDLPQQS